MNNRILRGVGASFIAASITLLGAGALSLASASATQPDPTHKSYVCKYVGTPGVDERLQIGQNPIYVDNAALTGKDETVAVGDTFSDKQGKSVVIVANTPKLDPEPSIKDCPAPIGPSESPTPSPTPTESSESPSPTPTESSETPTPTPTESSETPTPTESTPTATSTTETPTPIETTPTATPTNSFPNESGGCPVPLTNGKCVLPKTGSTAPAAGIAGTLAALAGSVLLYLGRRKGIHS